MPAQKTPKSPRPLIAGNWKMNGTPADLKQIRALITKLSGKTRYACDTMICPPATLLAPMANLRARMKARTRLALGGQDCHPHASGAHTGDISAEMLKQAKASAVIIGHSERRSDHGETDKLVKAKVEAAHKAGLTAIMCVGESLKERKSGDTLKVVGKQLRGSLPDGCTSVNTVIAYEPVWAIGSGLTPTAEQVAQVHLALRKALVRRFGEQGAAMRILYGGSVKPSNAQELMAVPHVNGALVGGASLKAGDFLGILAAYQQ
ncbi:MAG: triose-phosphate isomerase [Parvibaculales bacterium]